MSDTTSSRYIQVGAGDIDTVFPTGSVGFTDSNGKFNSKGERVTPDNPVTPAVTADFQGDPPTNSIFTPLVYHQYNGFTQWMNTNPQSFETAANGLQIANVSTPTVGADGNGYSFGPTGPDMTLGLVGLNVDQTKMAAQSDWSATADWGGQMRATMVQGGLFTYVNRLSSADVTIDFNVLDKKSNTTPFNQLTYTATGLTGAYNQQALGFNLPLDAGREVADQVRLLVSYDFNGDGKVDRTELYDTFSTDASVGWENYNSGNAKLLSSTGSAMQDMKNGSVKVDLWRINGQGDNISLQTDSASSSVTLPYTSLSANGAALPSSTLYVQGGATPGDQTSTLAATPGSTPSTDSLHVVPKTSTGGYTGPGQVWYNQGGVVGVTINGQNYGIFANSDVTWNYTATGLDSSLDGSNYYSVAILPDATVGTLMSFRQHAFAEVTGTDAEYSVDKATNTLTTSFNYTTQMQSTEAGLSSSPLTALYYHQYANSDATTENYSYDSARGEMKGFAGSSFSTTMQLAPILPLMPFLGTDDQKAQLQNLIHDQLKTFLASGQNLGSDVYYGSRAVSKYTDLAMLAQQVGYGQARDTFLTAAENQLKTWFTASDGDRYEFVYDKMWAAMIGYPGSFDADDKSNDLTLQLGYMVNAAATIATLDPTWAKQSNFGAMVDMVIKNANNPDRNDPTFGYLRAFDSYAGHNWASGTGFGITQESASESLNFDAAVARWGAATGEAQMENLGQYLYTTESQTFADYYLDVNNTAFPQGFDHSRIGILGADGAGYSTYFGAQPWYVQGINETPILSQSSLFLGEYPQEVSQDFNELNQQIAAATATIDPKTGKSEGPAVNDLWSNSFDKYLALGDPDAAMADYQKQLAAGYKDGAGEESKADTIAFIESLQAMGQIDITTHADSPYAAVYVKNGAKTYVAWNPSVSNATTVTFSDGTKLQVGVNSMDALTPDGQTYVTDFSAVVDQRPASVPLDLPLDPPANPLTTVAKSGDGALTLSVEANTGYAWITDGKADPRAVLASDDGTREKVKAANGDKLVAVGRDSSGAIHLLLAGGPNGTAPFYDKTLSSNYRVQDSGGALYGNRDFATLEPIYGQDFNGDGVVQAGVLKTLGTNGALTLVADGGNGFVYLKHADGSLKKLTVSGAQLAATAAGGAFTGVGVDESGSVVLLDTATGTAPVGWTFNSDGVLQSKAAYTAAAISGAEALFQVDLNGDGVLPAPLNQFVAKNGGLSLLADAKGNAVIRLENGSYLNITRDGNLVALAHGGGTLFAIGRDAQGNLRVMDGNGADKSVGSTHWAWQLDATGAYVDQTVYSGDQLGSAESIFNQDLNGDGTIAGVPVSTQPTTPAQPTGPQFKQVAAGGGDTLYVDPATGLAYLSVQGGAPVKLQGTASAPGDVPLTRSGSSFSDVNVTGGATLLLDTKPGVGGATLWTVDATGKLTGQTTYDAATVFQAELRFGKDIDGDGVVGDNMKLVTQNGTDSLYVNTVTGVAYVQSGAADPLKVTRDGWGDVQLQHNGYSLSAVATDNQGNLRVLDTSPNSDVSYAWYLDATGKWTGEQSFNKSSTFEAETLFNKDLDGDGTIGDNMKLIARDQDDYLWQNTATGVAYVAAPGRDPIAITRDGYDPAGVQLTRADYSLSAVTVDAQGQIRVLDQSKNSNTVYAWTLDSNGKWTGEQTFDASTFGQAETLFRRDLNNDGMIGQNAQPITEQTSQLNLVEKNGSDALYVDPTTGVAFAQVNGQAPIMVTRSGSDWGDVLLQRPNSGLVAIATDSQGQTRVLDQNPFSGVSYAWILDANGHWTGEQSFNSTTIGQAETLFSKDLNGDGVVGTKPASSGGSGLGG